MSNEGSLRCAEVIVLTPEEKQRLISFFEILIEIDIRQGTSKLSQNYDSTEPKMAYLQLEI